VPVKGCKALGETALKIHLIGEASNHIGLLSGQVPAGVCIRRLPPIAMEQADYDGDIAPEDVVVSLRFSRRDSRAPRFRLLHVPGAGVDAIDFDTIHKDTMVCNVYEHEIPISEYVLLTILRFEINPPPRSFSPEQWPHLYRHRLPHGEICGKTVALIGFGHIGRAVAARAKGFGMAVIATARSRPERCGILDDFVPPENLDQLLARADYIVVACGLNSETRGLLIGARELAFLKPTSVVINVARAEIIDEESLFRALQARQIAGAALDVWYRYPTTEDDQVAPSRFPFHLLDNVVCTPHSSAWTMELVQRRYALIADNVRRLLAGETLRNVVRPPQVEQTSQQ
jgi:phosphoglycerate dehydrogenase-like enzyme